VTTYRCEACGEMHDLPPFSWTFAEPTGWAATRDPSTHLWGELFDEQAIVHGPNGSGFYLRANLRLPVLDANENLTLVVWVSISDADFERAHQLWDDPHRVAEPPYFAQLCNRIPGYPDTWHLPAHVHTQPVGRRPLVELEPADHPLVADQKRGITVARVVEIAAAFEASMARPLS
jgi:hypothetical protein